MLQALDLPLLAARSIKDLGSELRAFRGFGTPTMLSETRSSDGHTIVPTYLNEFWTSAQRDAHNLHEVSYRACFKPQLPRFFIERLTQPGDLVYDPFMGRGTTLIEAALLGRVPCGNDINPLSLLLVKPRLQPPLLSQVDTRLKQIPLSAKVPVREDLLVFYHPETLQQICALRSYLLEKTDNGTLDSVDEWIRMVAINRLTGHSPGFFSVYTLPPNQAVSIKSQERINRARNQTPPFRDISALILRKSKSLLRDVRGTFRAPGRLVNAPAAETLTIPPASMSLVVTSPPFLDVVDYAGDNWMRCWFAGIDPASVELTVPKRLTDWQAEMTNVFFELKRILKPGGHIAFEVGEVRRGKIKLEETVITCGCNAGLIPELVLINQQEFTKTASCWGVVNNAKGTNSNRIVVFRSA